MAENYTPNFDPGSINIKQAIIYNKKGRVDVKYIMKHINIYEDITTPFITGKATISDTNGYLTAMPMVGEEMLFLEMETPILEINRTNNFFIYKIDGRENASMKNVVFNIYFISQEAFTDMNKKISYTFSNKISSIVLDLLTKDIGIPTAPEAKNAIIEETSNNLTYTSNFWAPSKNLTYLCKKALSKNNTPDYVFFENYDGFCFVSLETLYNQEPIQTFVRDQDSRQGQDIENMNRVYNTVLDMSVPVMFDYMDRKTYGAYGGSGYQLNLEYKNLSYLSKTSIIDYPKLIDNGDKKDFIANNEDDYPFLPEGKLYDTKLDYINLYDSPNEVISDIHIKRNSLIKRMDSFKIDIEVFGLCNYTIGTLVNFIAYKDMPISDEMDDEDLEDKILSGTYLITSINHEIVDNRHVCFMELTKDYYSI